MRTRPFSSSEARTSRATTPDGTRLPLIVYVAGGGAVDVNQAPASLGGLAVPERRHLFPVLDQDRRGVRAAADPAGP